MKNWFTALGDSQQKNIIISSWLATILSFCIGTVSAFFSYIFVAGLVVSILFTKWNRKTKSSEARSSFPQTEFEEENQVEISAPTPTETTTDVPKKKTETHRVAGTSYRLDDIKDLMGENYLYSSSKKELVDDGYVDERIYKFDVYNGIAVLEPEPDNPHDPKAVKVSTAGVHIGYIKAGSCGRVHNLLRDDRIERVEIEIKGGDYKIIFENYDDDTDKTTYSLERDSIPISAVLTLILK